MKLPENISNLFDRVENGNLTAKQALRKIKKLWNRKYIVIENGEEICVNELWERSFYKHLKRLKRRYNSKSGSASNV
jgi:hypothetical protein